MCFSKQNAGAEKDLRAHLVLLQMRKFKLRQEKGLLPDQM